MKGCQITRKRSPAKDIVCHRGLTPSLHSALCAHCELACMTTMTTDDCRTAKCQFIQAVFRHLRAFDVCRDCGAYRLFQLGYFLILHLQITFQVLMLREASIPTNNVLAVGSIPTNKVLGVGSIHTNDHFQKKK